MAKSKSKKGQAGQRYGTQQPQRGRRPPDRGRTPTPPKPTPAEHVEDAKEQAMFSPLPVAELHTEEQVSPAEPDRDRNFREEETTADSERAEGEALGLQTAEAVVSPTKEVPEPVRHGVADSGPELTALRARLALLEEKEKELDRLREEYVALRAALQERESARSEMAALQAEKEYLLGQLASERGGRQELIRKAEQLQWLEQANLRLQAEVEEMGLEWQPERITELELQVGALKRQITYLTEHARDLATRNEEVERRLAEADVTELDALRVSQRELHEENLRLSAELQRQELAISDAVSNRERLRQATRLQEQNLTLLQERTSLAFEVEKLRAQTTHMDAIQADYRRIQSENRTLKETIDAINESEERRRKQSERAFDTLQLVMDEPQCRKAPEDIRAWPGDRGVVTLVSNMAEATGFVFEPYQIQWLLAAMRSARLVILKGFSGLGKTSLPVLMARAIGAGCAVVPVQPSWRSKVDLLGFFNHFDQRFLPTGFTKALFRALQPGFKDRHFFIVLDEMNLSRVEYYFADFVVKLEDPSEASVELFDNASLGVKLSPSGIGQYIREGNQLRIPPNVTFFGTINDDETTFAVSDKVYDRAQVIHFYGSEQVAHGKLPKESDAFSPLAFKGYEDSAPPESEDPTLQAFLREMNGFLRESFAVNLAHRARMQIGRFVEAYAAAKGNRSEALDLQIISKILPKIRYSHRSNYGESLDQFGQWLQKDWPHEGRRPERTAEVLRLMQAQA